MTTTAGQTNRAGLRLFDCLPTKKISTRRVASAPHCSISREKVLLPLKRQKKILLQLNKKEYEDLKDLLVSFRHYFVIGENSLCISIMYYLFQ
jgi:hypothetical protein